MTFPFESRVNRRSISPKPRPVSDGVHLRFICCNPRTYDFRVSRVLRARFHRQAPEPLQDLGFVDGSSPGRMPSA